MFKKTTKWEYKVVMTEVYQQTFLNELGEKGWELVQVKPSKKINESNIYWLKRPKK